MECDHPRAFTLYRRGPRPAREWLAAYDCCEDCGHITPQPTYRPTGENPPTHNQ